MKINTIKKIITKKLDEFVESVEDLNIRELLKKNMIVSGGAMISPLIGREINDFDIYLRDKDDALQIVKYFTKEFCKITAIDTYHVFTKESEKEYFDLIDEDEEHTSPKMKLSDSQIKIFIKSSGINKHKLKDIHKYYTEKKKFTFKKNTPWDHCGAFAPIILTDNAISFTDDVQIICRFTGDTDTIMESFDFSHTKAWFDYTKKQMYYTPECMVSLLTKELKFTGSDYPLCSLFRIQKFTQRGFTISAGEIMRIAFKLNDFDLHDISVLNDQLIGVDYVYMQSYIERLVADKKGGHVNLDYAYLSHIIDEIFPQ